VSNLEKNPAELVCDVPERTADGVQLLEPREVPLGGPRALNVRRTLPQRARSLVGAWCFLDHYGPQLIDAPGAGSIGPHPHTGLQTVSWLFSGAIEHRDSVGSVAEVRPGQLNLMTAGNGIQHSELALGVGSSLHGCQLWVALPDASRFHDPFFEHYEPTPVRFQGATVQVFIGTLVGETSPANTFTELVGAQLEIPAGSTVEIPVDPRFEHAVLVDRGELSLENVTVPVANLGYADAGRPTLRLHAASDVRALLIGGVPLGESIVMWWNFIGRSHEEIVRFRGDWQREVIASEDANGRFGAVTGYDGPPLPAPELPNVRLRPRE
jgi:redox-sensitive bicupin YhaK (pirin superfamily)